MQSINIKEYKNEMGILIDIEEPIVYNEWHAENAINIPFNKLSYEFPKILDKNKKYYIYCRGGNKSKRITNILNIYGYNVTQVLL